MVLMDGRRDKIHAIVKKEDLESWEAELKEGKTYYMQVDLAEIPLQSYEFKIFEDIAYGNYDPTKLIDVIAVVEEVKFQLPNRNLVRVVFNFKDLR
ncbi:hypothetical protein JHK82_022895 [Glycine max]|nr:hypothetical protein JHK85_023407 [Glycine max]KAG5027025.1 hypothetical protein JHK86_022939 [Glycine max]KAG5138164.1 hypothetical protein JHK82_022895 [Glycine max]